MSENTRHREQIKNEAIRHAIGTVRRSLDERLAQKGKGTFASIHEILGIITEEQLEFTEAVKSNNHNQVRKELIDIAVGCVFGIACIDSMTLDW